MFTYEQERIVIRALARYSMDLMDTLESDDSEKISESNHASWLSGSSLKKLSQEDKNVIARALHHYANAVTELAAGMKA